MVCRNWFYSPETKANTFCICNGNVVYAFSAEWTVTWISETATSNLQWAQETPQEISVVEKNEKLGSKLRYIKKCYVFKGDKYSYCGHVGYDAM